jgi:hypothetical protein
VRPPPGLGWLDIHPTHYETLDLAEDATAEQVAASPGPGSADDAARRLARAVLADPLRRAVYDAWLARERAGLAAAGRGGPGGRPGGRPRWSIGAATSAALLVLLVLLCAAAWWRLAGAPPPG